MLEGALRASGGMTKALGEAMGDSRGDSLSVAGDAGEAVVGE